MRKMKNKSPMSHCNVVNELGTVCTLFSLWEHRRVIVCFARHMGCMFCKEQVAALKFASNKLNNEAASVVITIGRYQDIPKFRDETGFEGEIYVDSDLYHPTCYSSLKLNNGASFLFDSHDIENKRFRADTMKAAERATMGGFTNGGYPTQTNETLTTEDGTSETKLVESPYTGDVLQLGGVFVLGPGNACDYSFRSAYVGDIVDINELLTVVTGKNCITGEEYIYPPTLDWNTKLDTQNLSTSHKINSSTLETMQNGDANSLEMRNSRSDSISFANMSPELKEMYVDSIPNETHQNQGDDVLMYPTELLEQSNADAIAVTNTAGERKGNPSIKTGEKDELTYSTYDLSVMLIIVIIISYVNQHDPSISASEFDLEDPAHMSRLYKQVFGICCATCIAVAYFSYKNYGVPLLSKDRSKCLHIETDNILEKASVKLLKLSEIDKLILDSGVINCECKFLENVDMLHKSTSVKDDSQSTAINELKDSIPHKNIAALQDTLCYVREFLAKPNPHLGRKGPTCPFVPKCLKQDSIYMTHISNEVAASVEDMETILNELIQIFIQLEPKSGPLMSYKAIILIFPQLALKDAPEMIDNLQKRLKPKFVAEGLMLGEFHLNNNAPGLHNESFFPLRTPYPSLAIRYMVPSDIVFLNPLEIEPCIRKTMIETFLKKFGTDGDFRPVKSVDENAQVKLAKKLLKEIEMEIS